MTGAMSPDMAAVLAGVAALLVAATVAVAALVRLCPAHDFTELRLRVRSWWLIVSVLALALLLHQGISLVFFAVLSFLALKEYVSLIPTRGSDRAVILWAYLAIPLQYLLIARGSYDAFVVFVPLWMMIPLSMGMVLVGNTAGYVRAAGSLSWGLLITVFALGHLGFLLVLPAAAGAPGDGTRLLVYLVLLAQSGDVAQYLFGKLFGRRKMIPRISPNKTWEGLIGGVATATLLGGLLAPWLTPFDYWQGLLAGLVIGVAGFMGDATISAVKRDVGVKDTGTLLPGHGGVLDRVDSLIFSAPLFYHLVRLVH